MNLIVASGRLTADPTLSMVNDVSCVNFTLASDTRTKDASGNYVTIFYRVSVWRRLAENVAKYLHKGDLVTVQGDFSLRNYVDRDGQNRTSAQINATDVVFPGKRESAPASAPADDELPL